MIAPEFSRPERLDAIGSTARTILIAADPAERAALADRFGLVAIDALDATFEVRAEAAGIVAHGIVSAQVVQACSVTGEPIAVRIAERIGLRFVDEAHGGAEEIELSEETLDTLFHSGGAVDLGEAAAETVALALDPFPRGPNAEAALRAAGVMREDQIRPAGGLAGLKDLLGGA